MILINVLKCINSQCSLESHWTAHNLPCWSWTFRGSD